MLFDEHVIKNQSIAIIDSAGNSISYEQLCERAEKMVHFQNGRKLTCVICEKNIDTLSLVFQLLYLKQPMILLSEDASNEYIEEVIDNFLPDYVWRKRKLETVEKRIGLKDKEIGMELAILISTSGSIGNPKFVKISYENLKEVTRIGNLKYKVREKQKGILTVPFEHVFGLNFCLYHWVECATIIISQYSVLDERFLKLYDNYQVNNLAGIPVTYKMLNKICFWNNEERVSRLNVALVAGTVLDEELRKQVVELIGDKFWNCYGQTETTGVILTTNFKPYESWAEGVLGKPLEGIVAHIENGELAIQSKTICMGYAERYNDLITGEQNKGSLLTGDSAVIDEQNIIYITGRRKRFVKIMGKRYLLDNIEKMLLSNLNEDSVIACTGKDDEINVYIEGKCDEADIKPKIKNIMLNKMDISSRMIHIYTIEKMPKSSAGKVLYSKLSELV